MGFEKVIESNPSRSRRGLTIGILYKYSLTMKLLERYNKTISALISNLNISAKQLERSQISKVQNIFSPLYMNLDKIREFDIAIENAFTFVHLKNSILWFRQNLI